MISNSWHSYPSPAALGHKKVQDILKGVVIVEEKIDGSQFSFGVYDGELKIRSRGAQIDLDNPQKMFQLGVDYVKSIKEELTPGYMYTGEYLSKPKHNSQCYGRIPKNNIIVFDIRSGEEHYLESEDKKQEAERLGMEVVPRLFIGEVSSHEQLQELMATPSILGGDSPMEGIVIKNYAQFTADKKVAMAKIVCDTFKEKHTKDWKERNPSKSDIIATLTAGLCTEARWNKSVQHLKEAGTIEGSPKDIGLLIKEIQADVKKDSEEEIKDALFEWAWKQVERGITQGFPEWYKEQLAASKEA
ncbi:RNA ligase family protein [bacterium]|nr:RNA ligase family protein [bacterium]